MIVSLILKMSKVSTESTLPSAPIEKILYPDLTSDSEKMMNEKVQANKNFNDSIIITKDIRNYYEKETNEYNKKISKYKTYISMAEIKRINSIINSCNNKISCINRFRINLLYTNSYCYRNCLWFIVKEKFIRK